jgi:hypothetical protein
MLVMAMDVNCLDAREIIMPKFIHPALFGLASIACATVTLNSVLDSNRVWAAAIELTEARLDRSDPTLFG